MWNRKELKSKGKAAFKANYWRSVLAAIILGIVAGGAGASTVKTTTNESSSLQSSLDGLNSQQMIALVLIVLSVAAFALLVSAILKIFVLSPLEVGGRRFFRENSEQPAKLGEFGYGFKNRYGHVVLTMFLRNLFIGLWSLLFVIPGIVKTYSYRMVPYILADNPNMKATEAITLSRQMMKGYKWKTFVLDLSFIGWILLTVITCGIVGIFYVSPYMYATDAEIYNALKNA